MGKLNNTRVYLAGPIQYCPNFGMDWRKGITPFLNKLNIVSLDPTNKPSKDFHERPEDFARRKECKAVGDLTTVAIEMKQIRAYDLRLVDVADFLICLVDPQIFTIGTTEEITTANRSKKPCLIVVQGGRNNCPDWYLGMFESALCHIFDNFQQVEDYLTKIDTGFNDETGRWRFFDFNSPRNYTHSELQDMMAKFKELENE